MSDLTCRHAAARSPCAECSTAGAWGARLRWHHISSRILGPGYNPRTWDHGWLSIGSTLQAPFPAHPTHSSTASSRKQLFAPRSRHLCHSTIASPSGERCSLCMLGQRAAERAQKGSRAVLSPSCSVVPAARAASSEQSREHSESARPKKN